MKLILTIIIVCALMSILFGCATQPAQDCPPPQIVDTGCQWAQPIQVGASDTVETKKAALAAWKTYRLNCPNSR